MADKYIIRVTAGHTYDLADHVEVPVNQADPVHIRHEHMEIELNVRIRDYRGLPRASPATSPYFDTEPHAYNKDQYSIAFRFTPRRPLSSPSTAAVAEGEEDEDGRDNKGGGISGADLQFGNDFDHPIRDRLPPGFGTAMNIVRWWIDPGLEGDAYADAPYLYGPALSSFNALHVGKGDHDPARGGLWFDEGGDEQGLRMREEKGVPPDAKARMKWALREQSRADWVWEYDTTYGVDFYNPYIDFNDFALRLPGFNLPIIKYWDGQGLRYVLRNRSTGQVYLVVLFTLYLKEDVNEDGSLKPAALQATGKKVAATEEDGSDHSSFDDEKAMEEARRTLSEENLATTIDDDID